MLGSAGNVEELVEALEVRFLANRDDEPALRPADRFSRCRRRDAARGRGAAAPGASRASKSSTHDTGPAAARRSFCSIARAAGIPRSASGWATSASAASWATSTRCCAAAHATRFSLIVGDTTVLTDVKYVITLDTDTQLPRDAARATGRRHGAPAESCALLRAGGARQRGLRHPAAARRREPARAQRSRVTRACSAASPASTRTRAPSPTSTRTCSARARSSARASTTSMRSSARCRGGFRRTAS